MCPLIVPPYGLLQWGRNLSVAEGLVSQKEDRAAAGFNGAATFRLRKAVPEYWKK